MIFDIVVFNIDKRPTDSRNRCDPNTFYNQTEDYHSLEVLDDITLYVDYFTFVVVILLSPFLIITPFCIPKLRTLCRQAIAMIVLSDLINTLLSFTTRVNTSEWEKDIDTANVFCATVTFIENASYLWSTCWSFILLCCVLLNLYTNSVNKQKLFYILNLIGWSSGVLTTLILYIQLFPVTYSKTYISVGCQPKFGFEISDDGQKCLLSKESLLIIIPYYSYTTIIIFASQIVFGFIIYRAFSQYKRMKNLAESRSDESSSYEMEVKFSYSVLKNSIPFSITALIYVVIFIPLNVKQLLVAFNGPIQGKPTLQFFMDLWFACAGNFTTLMNLVFYGLLSKVLRQEVLERVRNGFSRVRLKTQRMQTSVDNADSAQSNSLPVRQSANGRQFDFDSNSISAPVIFFDDED